jgi:hypothetical protein
MGGRRDVDLDGGRILVMVLLVVLISKLSKK